MRFWIWRFASTRSDAAEKNHNIRAQLQSLIAPKMFWKIYFLYDFWCAQLNLFHSQPFLDYTNLTIAVSASDVRKFFYVYIYILGPKLLRWNVHQICQLSIWSYMKWGAQTLPPIFGLFAISDRNFANIVAPSSDKTENCVALLKGDPYWKKLKTASKLIHKPRRNDRSNCAPRRTHSPPDRSATKNTTLSHLQPARVRCSISPTYGGRASWSCPS